MFLADNTLIDVINSKVCSVNKNTNNIALAPNQNHLCAECESHKTFIKPFPETIRDSQGNIDTTIRDDSSISSSDSSSDDEDDNNNHNSIHQRMIYPPSNNEDIERNNSSLNQRMTQPQLNGEYVYNSLNQRIIEPLPSYSPSISGNESDTENLDRNQTLQNSNSNYSHQINGQSPFDDPEPVNQENSNDYIADSTMEGMDINGDRNQIRQQNIELAEEQFTEPLSEEHFRDFIIPNISSSRRSDQKMKKLRSKIRRKKDQSLQKLREKREKERDQVEYEMRKPIQNVEPGEEQFTAPVPEEQFMDLNVPISSKRNGKGEYDNFTNQMKKAKRVLPSRIRKQQDRKKKLKLLKLKNQRLKQLYYENKNQILENENFQKDESMDEEPTEEQFTTPVPEEQFMDVNVPISPKKYEGISEHANVGSKSNDDFKKHTTTGSKRPTIRLRKFGTLPKQENLSKPQIRVAKFADEDLIKDKRNLANELQYFCELCKIQFPRYSSLKQHLQENHEKKQYKIDFPDAGKYLALARKVKHKDDGSKFFYQNFNSNNDATTDLTSYWCSTCQKFFKNFQTLQSHMLEHEEGKTAAKRSNTRERKPILNKKIFYEPY